MGISRMKFPTFYNMRSVIPTAYAETGGTVVEQAAYRIHIFDIPGEYTFSFDADGQFEVYAWGGGGGGGQAGGWTHGAEGGGGGFSYATIDTNVTNFSLIVGSGGLVNGRSVNTISYGYGGDSKNNDSDNRYSGQGGGLSGIFLSGGFNPSNAILIAGGGGGGGASRAGTGNWGGAGGGLNAQNGNAPYDGQSGRAGRGGTQTGTTLPTDGNAVAPSQFGGGVTPSYGGGGGGGWWGGSAGTYVESNTMAGGGGGSGYANSMYCINPTLTTGSGRTAANNGSELWSGYGTGGAVAGNANSGAVIIKYYI